MMEPFPISTSPKRPLAKARTMDGSLDGAHSLLAHLRGLVRKPGAIVRDPQRQERTNGGRERFLGSEKV